MHYSYSDDKTSTNRDLAAFPLLQYAARSWFYHSGVQQSGTVSREAALLSSDDARRDWLSIHCPDRSWERPFQSLNGTGKGLYYASVVGLEAVVQKLLATGVEVNARGGRYGNALQAASERGHEKVVQMLMDAGADVNAQGGDYGNALQAASFKGQEKVVQMLMDGGADVNAQGGYYGNALQAASFGDNEKVVKMLSEQGACSQLSDNLTVRPLTV